MKRDVLVVQRFKDMPRRRIGEIFDIIIIRVLLKLINIWVAVCT